MTAPTVEQVLARHTPITFTDEHEGTPLTACSHDGDDWPCDARVLAEQVAALGVGDGEVEWGVRWQTWATADGAPHDRCKTREIAEHVARQDRHGTGLPGVVMCQRRGPWVEVTDEGGEGA